MHTANESVESLPQDVASIKTYNRIQAFPGGGIPAVVVVSSDQGPSRMSPGHRGMVAKAKASSKFQPPITVDTFPDHNVAR